MQSQKFENLLNMALETSPQQREKSQNLQVGFDAVTKEWQLIAKYSGDLQSVREIDRRIQVIPLLAGYAILNVPESLLEQVQASPVLNYIEKPKRLYFAVSQTRGASCVNEVQAAPLRLDGAGTLFALLDSGIDYTHPDFRNTDGTTRIRWLWDQTLDGNPPQEYGIGRLFSREEINEALQTGERLPTYDLSGHGTHVAGIGTSNGAASNGRYRGVAPQADLIVVKLGVPRTDSFPKTTELMMAVDFAIRKAMQAGEPVGINISFGNSYGSHRGTSLIETFLDEAAAVWKNVICVGTGNEGASAGHTAGRIAEGERKTVEFIISPFETTLNLQIWKNYKDIMDFYLVTPSGTRVQLFQENQTQQFDLGVTQVLLYYGEPNPYSVLQEIYLDFLPQEQFIQNGIWSLEIEGGSIADGRYEMWLPGLESLNASTEFLEPRAEQTLTIPSTSQKVISVAAYNAQTNAYADFSGRGDESACTFGCKPDLAAPGVDVLSAAVGGGYQLLSGTSMATPAVTGG